MPPRPDLVLVEHVEFRGAHRASEAELRHLSDVRNGVTMWAVDPEAAARGVEAHPWVARASAHRKWPSTLVIDVEEFEPVAVLDLDGALYYVDADARPFVAASADALDYPVISGVDADLSRVHPAIPRLILRDALWLATELDARGLVPLAGISEVRCSPTLGFDVHLTGGATVAFGIGGLEGQLARLAALTRRDVHLDDPLYIDLAPARVAIVRPLAPVGSPG